VKTGENTRKNVLRAQQHGASGRNMDVPGASMFIWFSMFYALTFSTEFD